MSLAAKNAENSKKLGLACACEATVLALQTKISKFGNNRKNGGMLKKGG